MTRVIARSLTAAVTSMAADRSCGSLLNLLTIGKNFSLSNPRLLERAVKRREAVANLGDAMSSKAGTR